ncbi:hypothetical protein [Salirhabdus sp. Marseille-P4669]|uniref:hypothetical protein n=1 Tax=Salirhabdus sp. Marseille-P4669 TaxID=2042310 RepID=UPI000C797879|nr:hypothetical protein [Salirhabdus sp. Marseille-P4669]
MRRFKWILPVFATFILVLPSFLITATTNDKELEEKHEAIQENGEFSSKDEVVYAKLDASGERQEIYVVNTLEIEKPGSITDIGAYSSVKNLTNLSEMKQINNTVQLTAEEEGKFYYQGTLDQAALPWDIEVTYFLNGEEIVPEKLAGKEGRVQIRIKTSKNEDVDSVFFENYMLQISLALNTGIFSNIQAEDGMIASAGKNKQVTFTLMPEDEEAFVVEADAVGFELDGIDISGVPMSMPMDTPKMDEMTEDMESLSDAISEINRGVGELNKGVSELHDGVVRLQDGSLEYKNGITELDKGSAGIVNGSSDIQAALSALNSSLNEMEGMDLSGLMELGAGLDQMSAGLSTTVENLKALKTSYSVAYMELDEAINAIPAVELSQTEEQALYDSNANEAVVDQLLETYEAAQKVKDTYVENKPIFGKVVGSIDDVIVALNEMISNLDAMATELSELNDTSGAEDFVQLQKGIAAIASNYDAFHAGLVKYTGGVSQLSDSYSELHTGISDLTGGTAELASGVGELHSGTTELEESTRDMPGEMHEEIDKMMAEYDKSDFEPVSFVSKENEKINSVQFVLKTDSIQYEEPDITEEPREEDKGFFDKLFDLFR